jgi:archaetidylinositol phosphate synthase
MLEVYIRPRIQYLFDLCAYACIKGGFTANTLTFIAFCLGICAALFLVYGYTIPALICLLTSGLCDVLDGTVARLTHSSHPFGAYLDLISDRMVESALVLALAMRYPHLSLLYILFLISVLLHFSTFLAAGALFKNESEKSMHYDRSIVERAEVFVIFICMIIAPHYQKPFLSMLTIVIFIAGLNRIRRVWLCSRV